MKKYIFKTVLCSALAVSLTTSCELDQYPESSIPAEKSWEKVSDAENFYIGLLTNLRSVTGGAYNYVSELQSDLFNAVVGAASGNQVHDWTFTTSQFDGDIVWQGNYGLTTTANNILDNIDNVAIESADDSIRVANIKGAAYFARAYAYSTMVLRYCVNYDAATAANEMGLPLVTKVDVNAKPSRATLQQTYDLILSDLKLADSLIVVSDDITAPNRNAVTALKARVLLNMKKYDEAIATATSLFNAFPLTDVDGYPYMVLYDECTETIFQPIMNTDERSGSYGTIFVSYNTAAALKTGDEVWNPYYVPTQGLIDLYEKNDVRKEWFFKQTNLSGASGSTVAKGYMFYKYPGNPNLRKDSGEDETNTFYQMHKPFRVAEMYLIAAEASMLKAQKDEKAAAGYLNAIRTSRGAKAIEGKTGDALFQEIKNEWVREFVGEGHRLNCLKRWNEPVVRMAPQNLGQLLINNPENEYTKLNVAVNGDLYYKMIWEIPNTDTQANGNLVGNW